MERNSVREILNNEELDLEAKVDAIENLHHAKLKSEKEKLEAKKDLEIENLNSRLDTANSTLEDLRKNNSDNESLQKTITSNEERIAQLEEELKESKISSSIELELIKAGAKNVAITSKVIDKDLISFDKKGNLIGLDSQIEKLKSEEDTSFLFNLEEVKEAKEEATVKEEKESPLPNFGYSPLLGNTKPNKEKTLGAKLAEAKKAQQNRYNTEIESALNSNKGE